MKEKTNNGALAIIPCFNEEHTIGSIILKTKRHVKEVLVIDDGSHDETSKIAKEAGAKVIIHKSYIYNLFGLNSLDLPFDIISII